MLPNHLYNRYTANKSETGGLSGVPLKEYSLIALRTLRSHLPASIPLIGCGGISTGADALEYAKAGASLVQVYTGFGYDGAGACRRIKDQLVEALEKEAYDLVLMDVQMPEMNGLEATQAIREKENTTRAHISIVAMTTRWWAMFGRISRRMIQRREQPAAQAAAI